MDAALSPSATIATTGRIDRLIASPWFWSATIACGLLVRLRQYFFAHSYWYDEAFLLLPIRQRGYAELLGAQPYDLIIPPLFLWITRALHQLAGDSELAMRLPALLAGIAALLLMIPLARRTLGNAHAIWAVLFLVVARHAISHGGEVRPYTFDLLFGEIAIFCTVILLDGSASSRERAWAKIGLAGAALVGPWISFPFAFTLGGAVLALALQQTRHGARRDWLAWCALIGIAGLSGGAHWWLSARHLYYPGLVDHWGHQLWGGFPDWDRPTAIVLWIAERPVKIAAYGTRELGPVVALLAIVGGIVTYKRSPPLLLLLVGPFMLALAAALLGKYPLADRTIFFLLPCLWLLAAMGIGDVIEWGRSRGRKLAVVGLLLVAWDFTRLAERVVWPDGKLDYRGAYQIVHAHEAEGDLLWSQTAVVHHTYYGKHAPVLMDHQFDAAVVAAKSQRLWVVVGDNRDDIRERFAATGARLAERHHVSGLDVLLYEPGATHRR